jgi:DNA ligase 1
MSDLPISRRRLVAALATSPVWGALPLAQAAPAALAVRLARNAPAGLDPTGYLVSEKYDGVRALWDGRTLRFRSGLGIAAPAGFIERLPSLPLDGELWLGRGRFEALSGLVRRQTHDAADWRAVRYMVFDLPGAHGPFAERTQRLTSLVRLCGVAQLQAVEQTLLDSAQALQRRLDAVVAGGGEGLMLHRADAPHETGRSVALLKLKPLQDAEARVIGHVAGRGRHEGRVGALRVHSDQGVEFLLGTGLSDAERERPPAVGSKVTFTHRGFTADGVPRFASFLRVRSEHF